MSAPPHERFDSSSIIDFTNRPLRERIADRLAEVLFGADEILQMPESDALGCTRLSMSRFRRPPVYDNVNTLMQSLCD